MPRRDVGLVEVTILEEAVRELGGLDPQHRRSAILVPERSVQIDGVASTSLTGEGSPCLPSVCRRRAAKDRKMADASVRFELGGWGWVPDRCSVCFVTDLGGVES